MSLKLCIDCRHYVAGGVGTAGAQCLHPRTVVRSLIDGSVRPAYCEAARLGVACGPNGELFEAKNG